MASHLYFKNNINIVHPEIDVIDSKEVSKSPLQPVYHSSEKLSAKGLNSKGIHKLLKELLPQIKGKIDETLSNDILSRLVLVNKEEALLNIHNPRSLKSLERAQKRLKFEELFFFTISPFENET